uniref:Putative polysaccharide biosynthesis protein n=1 Tax=uncultured bacterium fosmid pJB135F11 TaxID=1478051 RepID=A0A0H3U8L5_9BACT|nr:putative polysaccharide biosynthesis protein [uncultured bacterium fosmid pJB135F11]
MILNRKHPLYQEDIRNILRINDIDVIFGKTFLITGATGMIGVMLIDALMALKDVKVIAIGRSVDKAKSRLGAYFSNSNFEFIEHDVCQKLPENIKVDYIIPMASNTHPLAYSKYPIETIMVNIKGVEHALDLADRCNAMVIYTSTNEIYGDAIGDEDFTEDYNGRLNLSNARACYNESKRTSEALCQSYIAEHGTKVKIVRLSRIFGPTMLENDSKASSQFIKKALASEDIILKSKGDQYFSYTYVADAVVGLLTVLLKGEIGCAYNVSSEKTNMHLKDFARLCALNCGKNVIFEPPSEIEKKGFSIANRAILTNNRIKSLGFNPIYEMDDAIKRTIEILR